MTFKNKIVAVMNEKKSPGVVLNALAHISLGLGASYQNKEDFRLTNYTDADGGDHAHVSEMPLIVLAANSNKLRALRKAAFDARIFSVDYTGAMTGGTYQDQLLNSSQTREEDLEYYGIILFGDWDKVSELTKKFSLWK